MRQSRNQEAGRLIIQPTRNDTGDKMNDAKTISLLEQAYAAELETVQNYLANSVWLDGLGAQEVSESLAEDVTEA